ncbi:MAG TPA: hypothetical protein PLY88_02380 [Candidatus Omnitrophota bacterium]|nr:hypothetical protein [Candidatus Omnitrophota bacterium]
MGSSNPVSFTADQIRLIAYHQKKMLAWFAARFIATGFLVLVVSLIARNTALPAGGESQPPLFFQLMNYMVQGAYWFCSIWMFRALYHLSQIMQFFSKKWLLWAVMAICFVVGLLGVLFLLYAIIQSNRVLKAYGIKIGLMGADRASVDDFLKRSPL